LVIATPQGDDVILCQITSQDRSDSYSVSLDQSDFSSGGLNQSSRVRPNRLFTADEAIIIYRAGQITNGKLTEVLDRLIEILKRPWNQLMEWLRRLETVQQHLTEYARNTDVFCYRQRDNRRLYAS